MVSQIKSAVTKRMENSLRNFENELRSIRTGRASPNFLDSLNVEVYGSFMPINQLGSVTAQDSKLLVVQVWDKEAVKHIEKAINNSDLGVSASSEGQLIRIPFPPLSEERRRDLVKLAHKYSENSKIAIRNIRRDGIEEIKKLEKAKEISEDEMHKSSDEIQKVTDDFNKKIEAALANREKDIMQV